MLKQHLWQLYSQVVVGEDLLPFPLHMVIYAHAHNIVADFYLLIDCLQILSIYEGVLEDVKSSGFLFLRGLLAVFYCVDLIESRLLLLVHEHL